MILQGLRVEDTTYLFGNALSQKTWPKKSSINMRFGMRWKGRDASVLLVKSLTVRIFLSASGTCSSCEKRFMRKLEVLVRNDSNSPSILNWTNLKPRRAERLWMFPMHLVNVYTLPFSQYYAVQKKMRLKTDIKKRTPLTFVTSAHIVMYLYLEIMWGGRREKYFLVGFSFLRTVSPSVSEDFPQNSLLPLVHPHAAQDNLVFHHPVSPRTD